jgi:spermidine synthase
MVREAPKELLDQLKYYSTEMHDKAFVLPAFAARRLGL